jgi:hypothetical protein
MSKRPTNGKYHASAIARAVASENPSPDQAMRRAVAAVFGALEGIVKAMIARAQEGSHLHAKLLFDLAGISAASSLLPPEAGAQEPALTRMLMEKLDQMAKETASAEDKPPVE